MVKPTYEFLFAEYQKGNYKPDVIVNFFGQKESLNIITYDI